MEGINSIVVEGLSEHSFETNEEALKILHHGLYYRKMYETVKNTESSRSHAVFQIRLY